MKTYRICAATALACVAATTVLGQRMFSGPRDYGSQVLAKVFGKNDAFSAIAEMTIVEKQDKPPMQMEMTYAFLKGDLRTEMDMASMKGTSMPPDAVAQMKQMGMDRNISIFLGGKKLMYLIYPGLKAYCEMSQPASTPSETNEHKQAKIDITEIGKETVDGHPCVKNKITVTSDDGTQHEVIAWQATDMKDFPIKTEMTTAGATITTHFRDIKLSPPAASLFAPPADFTRYSSMQEMMMSSMQQFMPPAGGAPPRNPTTPQPSN